MGTPADAATRPVGSGALEGVGIPPGLQTDCEALLSRFQEMDSVRFEDFAELWRSMKFATIFWWVCLAARRERSLGPRFPPGRSPWVAPLHVHRIQTSASRPPPVLFTLKESTLRNKVTTPRPGPPRMNPFSTQQSWKCGCDPLFSSFRWTKPKFSPGAALP